MTFGLTHSKLTMTCVTVGRSAVLGPDRRRCRDCCPRAAEATGGLGDYLDVDIVNVPDVAVPAEFVAFTEKV